MTTQLSRTGPANRISDVDFLKAENIFISAMSIIVPDDRSQRKAFESLMPYMYVLRNKGCSWAQLTKLLNDCGLRLQPATVSTYYGEMLSSRLDICQEQMNEQILIMAEVRKESMGFDKELTAKRVSAVLTARTKSISETVDNFFGVNQKAPTAAAPVENKNASPSKKVEAIKKQTPVEIETVAEDQNDSFGLLNIAPQDSSKNKNGFIDPTDDEDNKDAIYSVNNKQDSSKSVKIIEKTVGKSAPVAKKSKTNERHFVCEPLQPGVGVLDKRNNVPEEVYLPGDLPHPMIDGLMLSMDARLYKAALEYKDMDTGKIHIENTEEQRFRITWRKPVRMQESSTSSDFINLDPSLFKK